MILFGRTICKVMIWFGRTICKIMNFIIIGDGYNNADRGASPIIDYQRNQKRKELVIFYTWLDRFV